MVQHNTTTTLESSLYSQTLNTLTLNFPLDQSMVAYIMNITANKTLYSPVKDLVSNIKTYTKNTTSTVIEFNAGYLAQADLLHIQIFEEDNPINFHYITHVTGVNGWIATYTSASTLTLLGLPFTIDEATCSIASILIQDVNYVSRKLEQGRNGISFYSLNDVVYVLKYGIAYSCFINTDKKYRVAIMAHKQAVDVSTDSEKTLIQNPINKANVTDSIVESVAIIGDNYYPSVSGMSMDDFKHLSITGNLSDSGFPIYMSLEVSNLPSPSVALDWIPVYLSDVKNNLLTNLITCPSPQTTYLALMADLCNFKWFRIKLTCGSIDIAAALYIRRLY